MVGGGSWWGAGSWWVVPEVVVAAGCVAVMVAPAAFGDEARETEPVAVTLVGTICGVAAGGRVSADPMAGMAFVVVPSFPRDAVAETSSGPPHTYQAHMAKTTAHSRAAAIAHPRLAERRRLGVSKSTIPMSILTACVPLAEET